MFDQGEVVQLKGRHGTRWGGCTLFMGSLHEDWRTCACFDCFLSIEVPSRDMIYQRVPGKWQANASTWMIEFLESNELLMYLLFAPWLAIKSSSINQIKIFPCHADTVIELRPRIDSAPSVYCMYSVVSVQYIQDSTSSKASPESIDPYRSIIMDSWSRIWNSNLRWKPKSQCDLSNQNSNRSRPAVEPVGWKKKRSLSQFRPQFLIKSSTVSDLSGVNSEGFLVQPVELENLLGYSSPHEIIFHSSSSIIVPVCRDGIHIRIMNRVVSCKILYGTVR